MTTPIALITGGSRGIGRAVCRTMAKKGWHAIATGRDEGTLAETARMISAEGLLLGIWGDFQPSALRAVLDHFFGRAPSRANLELELPEPVMAPGLRVQIVDKPDRTQCQVVIGALGTSAHDRDHVALMVANTAFGGLFTSRLNEEVRVKRPGRIVTVHNTVVRQGDKILMVVRPDQPLNASPSDFVEEDELLAR